KKLEDNDLTIIFLPPYSPELNPTERFFQEMRKVTANRIFENIEEQEKLIDEALTNYMKKKESIKQLWGYEWIIEGWNKCLNV
ncbi:transposase, partial [Caminibacter sp.]